SSAVHFCFGRAAYSTAGARPLSFDEMSSVASWETRAHCILVRVCSWRPILILCAGPETPARRSAAHAALHCGGAVARKRRRSLRIFDRAKRQRRLELRTGGRKIDEGRRLPHRYHS